MSTVWASDVDGWDDDFGFRTRRSVGTKGDDEYGEPPSFIDITDPRVSKYQREYDISQQKEFNNNIELIKNYMINGVLMPSKSVLPNIIRKLKEIAGK